MIILSHMNSEMNVYHYPDLRFKQNEDGICYPHDEWLVVILKVLTKKVDRILIDIGSSCDIIYRDAREKIELRDLMLKPISTLMMDLQERL